jgi:hypothetical protein
VVPIAASRLILRGLDFEALSIQEVLCTRVLGILLCYRQKTVANPVAAEATAFANLYSET